jgi:hypothetical protein
MMENERFRRLISSITAEMPTSISAVIEVNQSVGFIVVGYFVPGEIG